MSNSLDAPSLRPFRPEDRPALRRLCWETADQGKPFAAAPFDPPLLVDLLMNYYTDIDSSATWVLDQKGAVVGYLTGCLDEARYGRRMAGTVVPDALLRAFSRGTLFSRALIGYLWSQRGLLGAGWAHESSIRRRYPAHLHVNLHPSVRGGGWGQKLVERFIEQVKARGLPGLRAATLEENAPAIRFFERLGFKYLARQPTLSTDFAGLKPSFRVIYGRLM